MISRCNKFVKSYTGPWRILQGPALTMKGNMKEIMVRGKKVKVPFKDADYNLDGEQDVTISNRFSGAKATLPGYAAAVYDVIIGSEQLQQWDNVRTGLDWFKKYFPKQYMVLLD
jgi:hypothetical protein